MMALRMIIGVSSLTNFAVAADPPVPANVALPWGPADCFIDKTFEDSEVFFMRDIEFGSADNPFLFGKKNESLTLDVAFPSKQDTRSLRPVLVWVHGGAFIGGEGSVDSGDNKQMVMTMTTRGYVVVSINYRLLPTVDIEELNTVKPAQVAVEDARAAVRFVRKMAKEWRVDTSRIVVGGDSAGAITAMGYGYVKKFSDGHSGNPGYDSSINAVLAVSGSMLSLGFCSSNSGAPDYTPAGCTFNGTAGPDGDLTDQMVAGDIPAVMIEGTADNVVPYYGALKAKARAEEVGVNMEFLSVPGAGHVPYGDVFNENEPYFRKWLTHVSGSLNLAEAECPSSSSDAVV